MTRVYRALIQSVMLCLLTLNPAPAPGSEMVVNTGHDANIGSLDLSEDGRWLLTSEPSHRGNTLLWDFELGRQVRSFAGTKATWRGNKATFLAQTDHRMVTEYDAESGRSIRGFKASQQIEDIAYSAATDQLYVLTNLGQISARDLTSNQITSQAPVPRSSSARMSLNPDAGRLVLAVNESYNALPLIVVYDLQLRELNRFKIKQRTDWENQIMAISFVSDQHILIARSDANDIGTTFEVYDVTSGTLRSAMAMPWTLGLAANDQYTRVAAIVSDASGSGSPVVSAQVLALPTLESGYRGTIASYSGSGGSSGGITFASDGDRLITGYQGIEIHDTAAGQLVRRIEAPLGNPSNLAVAGDMLHLGVGNEHWLFDLANRRPAFRSQAPQANKGVFALSADGLSIIHEEALDYSRRKFGLVRHDAASSATVQLAGTAVDDMALTSDDRQLITIDRDKAGGKRRLARYDSQTLAALASWSVFPGDVSRSLLRLSPDNQTAYLSAVLNRSSAGDYPVWLAAVDLTNGQLLWSRKDPRFNLFNWDEINLAITADGSQLLRCSRQQQGNQDRYYLDRIQTDDGSISRTPLGSESCRDVSINPASGSIVVASKNALLAFDPSGEYIGKRQFASKGPLVFTTDGSRIIVAEPDERVRVYDSSSLKLLVTLVPFRDAGDWVSYTPDGRFDGTQGGFEKLHFVDGLTVIPLDRLFERFYQPNLLAQVITGATPADITQQLPLTPPPRVEIVAPPNGMVSDNREVRVTVSASDQGGGVNEVRLYVNGKLVSSDQRGVNIRSGENWEFNISLAQGENLLRATALNEQRTESQPSEVQVRWDGPRKSSELYLLVVGLNEYRNPRYSLNYALSDAIAFRDAVLGSSRSIFADVHVTFLSDAEVTRSRLLATLDDLASRASEDDVFVFYYAGHGVMSEEDKPLFYIVPHDVTQLYGDNDQLQQRALSAAELKDFSTRLRAQKQLFVLDACQSGGAAEMLALRGAAEERAIAQLARSTGTFWLTASGSEQFASEFAELGHGVFTKAILLGLAGEADGGKRDGKITVKELSAFLNDKVPELSEQYRGELQFPTSYGFGQDFPVVVTE